MNNRLALSSSPHITSDVSTSRLMLDVLIALVPASLAGVYYFGLKALLLIAVCIISSVAFEYVFRTLILKRSNTISDLSAAVTGLLLALNLPPSLPVWIAVVGSFVAIVVIKQLFGGIGQNFINPALGARAFLVVAYGPRMTRWTAPAPLFSQVDAVSTATPLGILKEGGAEALPDYLDMFLGNIGGCLGETSAIALIIGGVYLLARKVISWEIPTIYIATVGLLSWILGPSGFMTGDPLFNVLAGGLLIGAIYMATDYTTSPMSRKGIVIYALGCGLLTVLFRQYTNMPEGVSFAILLMNVATPLIDRYTVPKRFGGGAHA
jgi:electron transport complex protein RnfD